jgi:HPt (histidine-containing phosphotransfer) domain-containing protein
VTLLLSIAIITHIIKTTIKKIMGDLVLDETLLLGYFDSLGGDIVDQMIVLYEQQSKIYLEEIRQAIEINTQVSWQESCHKMKGAAGSVGLKELHSFLVSIEKSTADMTEKKVFLTQLSALNTQGVFAFKAWQNTV